MRVPLRSVVVVLLAVGLSSVTKPAVARAPGRMLVEAREFSFAASRDRIHSGTELIELVNQGEDPHQLALRRVSRGRLVGHTWSTPQIASGAQVTFHARLAPGRYRFWCPLTSHTAKGMRGTLVVVR
jgi:plastocyanin